MPRLITVARDKPAWRHERAVQLAGDAEAKQRAIAKDDAAEAGQGAPNLFGVKEWSLEVPPRQVVADQARHVAQSRVSGERQRAEPRLVECAVGAGSRVDPVRRHGGAELGSGAERHRDNALGVGDDVRASQRERVQPPAIRTGSRAVGAVGRIQTAKEKARRALQCACRASVDTPAGPGEVQAEQDEQRGALVVAHVADPSVGDPEAGRQSPVAGLNRREAREGQRR